MENIDNTNHLINFKKGFNNLNCQFYLNYSIMKESSQYDHNDRIIQQSRTPDSNSLLGTANQSNLDNLTSHQISISYDLRYYLTFTNFILVVTLPSSPKNINLSGNFLWGNGSQVILPTQFTTQIVNSMNNFTHSNPYFIKNKQNRILLSYKFKAYKLHSIFNQLQSKMKIVIQYFQSLLSKYGIINPYTCPLDQDKLRSTKICLQSKQRIAGILQKNLKIKKQNQKKKLKNEQKHLNIQKQSKQIILKNQQVDDDNEQDEQIITVCEYYDQIKKQQNYSNKISSNSSKFNIINSKFLFLNLKQDQQREQDSKKSNPNIKQIFLIQKIVKQDLSTKLYNKAIQKLNRQINIFKNIKYGKQYFLTYYLPRINNFHKNQQINYSHQNFSLIMQHCQTSLSFFLDNDLFNLDSALSTFLDIIKSIQKLHKSGIVHRDLKPQNIMMNTQTKKQNNRMDSRIKIIDFSDSALISQKVTTQLSNSLGYSLPYSPFECSFYCNFGINNLEIDIWSLGIILHELIYKRIPHIFHRGTKLQQFITGIKQNQLCIRIDRKWSKNSFLGNLEQVIHIAIRGCLNLRQCDRIRLKYLKQLVIQAKCMNLQIRKLYQGIYFNQF